MSAPPVRDLLAHYRVTAGRHLGALRDRPTDDERRHAIGRERGEALLADGVERLSALQARLYAANSWALLAVFQAMDAGGKDGTIRHVMSGVNPQGVRVASFKQPGPAELAHDFLWRVHREVPGRGQIGIFNRSHYEEVLAVRVHPELLEHQHLPGHPEDGHKAGRFWRRRLRDIAHFESFLSRQGVVPVKFFLHVSKEEQRRRLLSRLEEPGKLWKFSSADLAERALWDRYQACYEDAIRHTASRRAAWYVVPADSKWFAHLVVVEAMIATLEAMDLKAPEVAETDAAELKRARAMLEAEG